MMDKIKDKYSMNFVKSKEPGSVIKEEVKTASNKNSLELDRILYKFKCNILKMSTKKKAALSFPQIVKNAGSKPLRIVMKQDEGAWRCYVMHGDHVVLASGYESTQKKAKCTAYDNLAKAIGTDLCGYATSSDKGYAFQYKKRDYEDYGVGFILKFEERDLNNHNYLTMIKCSAEFNKLNVEYNVKTINSTLFECTMVLGGPGGCVLQALGASQSEARNNVSEKAVVQLQATHATILVCQFECAIITKDDLMGVSNAGGIGNCNVGHKLLSKLGWTSGGLGIAGKGREFPVVEGLSRGKEGLGALGTGDDRFISAVKIFLQSYISSNDLDPIMFGSEYDKNEKYVIHSLCDRYFLKSKNVGFTEHKNIHVSRKLKPSKIVEFLRNPDAKSNKYVLFEATHPV